MTLFGTLSVIDNGDLRLLWGGGVCNRLAEDEV